MVCMSNLIKIILSCEVFLLFIEDFSFKQDLNKALTYVNRYISLLLRHSRACVSLI